MEWKFHPMRSGPRECQLKVKCHIFSRLLIKANKISNLSNVARSEKNCQITFFLRMVRIWSHSISDKVKVVNYFPWLRNFLVCCGILCGKRRRRKKNERWKGDIIVGWIFTGREMCRQISGGLNVSDVLLVIRRANEITIIFSFFLRDFFVLFALWMGFPLLLVAATFMNVVVLVRRRRAKECKFCNDLQVYFFARSWQQ